MQTYPAPLGIAASPFGGAPFPGAPPFGTPSASAGMRGISGVPIGGGPAIGSVGIADFAQGVVRPNRSVDWHTNGQVVQLYTMVASHEDASRLADIGPQMLCFCRTVFKGDPGGKAVLTRDTKRLRFTGFAQPGMCVEAFEVTQLNVWLREEAQRKQFENYTAEQMTDEFRLLGTLQNETASAGPTDRGLRSSTRNANFAVAGRCQTFCLWDVATIGASLWFVVKKVRARGDGATAWQFVPMATPRGCKPSTEDLRFRDRDYAPEKDPNAIPPPLGKAVFVGTLGFAVGDVALLPHQLLTSQPLYLNKATRPTVEVFLRI